MGIQPIAALRIIAAGLIIIIERLTQLDTALASYEILVQRIVFASTLFLLYEDGRNTRLPYST